MRALIKLFFLLLLLAVPLLAGVAFFALASEPMVSGKVQLAHDDIARAKAIIKQNDPRRLPPGAVRSIQIAPKDLNLATNYLLQQTINGKARIALADQLLRLNATLPVARLPLRNYINIDAAITSKGGRPRISRLQIGRLHVPDFLSNGLLALALDRLASRSGQQSLGELLQDLRVTPEGIELTLHWDDDLLEKARTTLLGDGDRDALRFYHDELVRLMNNGLGNKGRMIDLLRAMFAAAQTRSYAADPVLENTALLTVLGTWASRQDLARLVPGDLQRPGSFRWKLDGRTDFAQHFLASAALAARGDSTLSDAVGLLKEINDTDAGSGFSFTDIAADRAGTRFGSSVTADATMARDAQHRLAAGIEESAIMPSVKDLPEHLRGAEFRQRFGHVGSPEYHAMMQEIERRIGTCSFYQN